MITTRTHYYAYRLILLSLAMILSLLVQAQETVSGTVRSGDDQNTLVGVSVLAKGTQSGALTDANGQYALRVPSGADSLIFSYIGYTTQVVVINGRSTIDVTLSSSVTALDEVVVVGYGTQKKSNVTGSIVSVTAEDIGRVQTPSFDFALQGKVPGVYVTTSGGQPGGGVNVRIRGIGAINNSNPLYVIDGVIVSAGNSENSNPLAALNPNDIESIDILKDAASTAIYGTRAANGVVLITTKRGSEGAPRLNYSGYYGIQQSTSEVPRPMNAMEFAENMNRAFTAAGEEAPFPNPSALGEGTNWIDEMFGTGQIQDHQVSVSGGSPRNSYYVSGNYFRNDGIMIETFHERISFRVNTDNQIGDKFRIGNSLGYSRTSRYQNGTGNRTFIHGTVTNIYQALPTIPVRNEDGSYGGPTDTRLERRENVVARQERPDRNNAEDRIIGNIYAEFEPIDGLRLRTTFSADLISGRNYIFTPIWEEGLLNSNGLSDVNYGTNTRRLWLWENTLTYSKTLGNHTFSITGGTSAQDLFFRNSSQTAQYDTDVFKEISNSAVNLNSSTNSAEESISSIFGRLTYDYDNRYLLTVNVRRDGSSKFGPNNKYGTFPSFSMGWRISEESFFPRGVVNNLKLRGGWGQVGSDAIGNFRYVATLGTGFNYAFGNEDGTSTLGAALADLANPDVQWETVTEYNLGIDAGLLGDRLTFSAEYFNRTRTDMLLVIELPGVSGLEETVDNVGELVNSGFEMATAFRKLTGDFTYDFNFNITTFKSEVVDLAGKDEIIAFTYSGSGATSVIRPGEPLGVFLGLVTEGLFQTEEEVEAANAIDGDPSTPYQLLGTGPGDFRFGDLNGDGKIDASDKKIIGSPVPDFTFGFGGSLGYKQFDLNFQFFGTQGNDILHIARSQLESSGRAYNKSVNVVDAWSGPGTSNTIPRPHLQDPNQNVRVGTHLVEDGSFLRLRNLQLGYTLSGGWMDVIKLRQARVYLAGQNLFVLTDFTGIDPEVGLDENNSARAGIYQDLYPQVRTFSLGLNLGF